MNKVGPSEDPPVNTESSITQTPILCKKRPLGSPFDDQVRKKTNQRPSPRTSPMSSRSLDSVNTNQTPISKAGQTSLSLRSRKVPPPKAEFAEFPVIIKPQTGGPVSFAKLGPWGQAKLLRSVVGEVISIQPVANSEWIISCKSDKQQSTLLSYHPYQVLPTSSSSLKPESLTLL